MEGNSSKKIDLVILLEVCGITKLG